MGAICEGEYNYVFVTSTFHIGDLGGIENADQICNERARDAGLPGTYRAYLATSTESPEERLGSSSGWLRPDRRPFVYSRDDLVSSLIRFPLLLDEHGRLSEHVGQGLRIGSTHQNCLDWTSADTSHRVPGGYVGLTVRWNEGALGQCHTEEPLYCFGIDHDAPIPPVSVGGRLAFLTRGAVSPDEGRDAADRLCADEAAAAGLPGSFKALVATSTEAPLDRFSLDGPTWVRTDGIPLWEKAEDARNRVPLATLNVGADGSLVSGTRWVLIGSTALDQRGENTCNDWSASTEDVPVNLAIAERTINWIPSNTYTCERAKTWGARVFCLQE